MEQSECVESARDELRLRDLACSLSIERPTTPRLVAEGKVQIKSCMS